MEFDATSIAGQWDVIGEMHVEGIASWADSIEFLNQTVVFSSFDFELTAAHDRSVEPGQTTQLTFSVKNTGVSVDELQHRCIERFGLDHERQPNDNNSDGDARKHGVRVCRRHCARNGSAR